MEAIMTNQPPTLRKRIDVALQSDAAITSADLAALIEETETYIGKAYQTWKTVDQTSSLDPEAKRQALNATLAANGLQPLLPKLQARYEQVHEQEQTAAWLAKHEAAWLTEHDVLKHERDALAEELREVYPDAASKIAALFSRIDINDKALGKLHLHRPARVERYLRSAEQHARGPERFNYNSLLASVRLFDWDTGHQIWPLPQSSMASVFAATSMVACDRRFSADWAKENERRAAGRRAEQQRIADYYERTKKEQEDRENAEARERFMEQQQRLSVNRPPRP
jgi:hypothetical protein